MPNHVCVVRPERGRWLRVLVNLVLRIAMKWRHGLKLDIAVLRRRLGRMNRYAARKALGVRREPAACTEFAAEWLTPGDCTSGRVLLYFHGGAFVARSPDLYAAMVAPWCRALNARALMVDYRLAPEHPYPAGIDDCHRAYRWLLDQDIAPENIVIAGDSAGGNLALAILLRAKNEGAPLPSCAVLLSPFLDLTLSGDSMLANARRDPLFTLAFGVGIRRFYAEPFELLNPEVSPLFGDFAGLPPMLIQVGSSEVLLDDATRAAAQARANGVDVELEIWERQPHVFQAITALPQAHAAAQNILGFVRTHAAWADRDTA
ncbi:alpha/beta hydrolase [Spectribacter hydrogenoxidans]|uniref:Alpha/beta hydrolase n=1 Tax=Spectribacter hydrogenoxidans TaxID=3075608 RepID=A0ABU3BZB8_9GAMM|nr:alpha/beta hydrolase [Salinisphaera sp. W335]MDT0634610.1 alpha/beta hydrolase [Salinisphaera sp. W335]